VCLDGDGKSLFYDLLFRRCQPRFVAFDLLYCDGLDLTYSPLVERKQRLRAILPKPSQSVLFCDHVEATGEELFALACKRDLEGIVAKHKFGPYLQDGAQWFKNSQPEVFAVGWSEKSSSNASARSIPI
jgi:bifunctional non-homologous end joining protein LigD